MQQHDPDLVGLPTHPSAWVVANPAAGRPNRKSRAYTAVGALAEAGWTLSWRSTRGPGHAAELASRAAREGVDIVVVVGGDGTVNEVANGLAGSDCALALLPAGTGNVLAAQLGLLAVPTSLHVPDPVGAARRLAAGRIRSVDLGHARARGRGGRHFVLWAGVGLDAEIVRRVEGESRSWKRSMGPVAYAAIGVRSLLEMTGTPVTLRHDAERARMSLLMAVVANVPLYGGAVQLAPAARIDDERLDLVLFPGKGPPDTLRHLAGLASPRPTATGSAASVQARTVSVVAEAPLPVHLDAEPFGQTPFFASVAPGALRLVVPEGAPIELFQPVADPRTDGPDNGAPRPGPAL